MRLGGGRHTYQWVEGWGMADLPPGVSLGYTHGVVVDAQDRVYVHNRSRHAILVFDRDGNHLTSWGESFKDGAHGLLLSREDDGEEYLYLADPIRHLVCKTRLDGTMLWWMGKPRRPDIYRREDDYKPTDVAVAPNGDFYVCDGYGQSWIHQYDRDCRYVRSFGGPAGPEPGRVDCPHGLWVDTRGGKEPELYVADRTNHRIQVFALDGKHKRFITAEMKRPCCFYPAGEDMVVPDLDARVTILDRDDNPVVVLGDNPDAPATPGWPNIQDKLQPGRFNSPHAACVDSHGDIYVVEWIATGRVTKLRKVGG